MTYNREMPITGKLFQFNIDSPISFQFRAGFISMSRDHSQTLRRSGLHQDGDPGELREHKFKVGQKEDSASYEVIDSPTNWPQTDMQRSNLDMLSLPAHTVERTNPLSTHFLSDNSHSVKSYQKSMEYSYRKAELIQSYNRNGERLLAMPKTPIIDLFI